MYISSIFRGRCLIEGAEPILFPELKGVLNDHTYSCGANPAIAANRRSQALGKATF